MEGGGTHIHYIEGKKCHDEALTMYNLRDAKKYKMPTFSKKKRKDNPSHFLPPQGKNEAMLIHFIQCKVTFSLGNLILL
jgi:hypothetical protein